MKDYEYLYLTDKQYLAALINLKNEIINGVKLKAENSNCTGDKYNWCDWGLCTESKRVWSDPASHLWPDQFVQDGRVAPKYRKAHHRCPLDPRADYEDGNGCFWQCLVFNRANRKRVTKKQILKLIDDRIRKIEAVLK